MRSVSAPQLVQGYFRAYVENYIKPSFLGFLSTIFFHISPWKGRFFGAQVVLLRSEVKGELLKF